MGFISSPKPKLLGNPINLMNERSLFGTLPHWIATYDISVSSKAGRRRARRVRKTCNEYGDRIQKSVYMICASNAQASSFRKKLETIIDSASDKVTLVKVADVNFAGQDLSDKIMRLVI